MMRMMMIVTALERRDLIQLIETCFADDDDGEDVDDDDDCPSGW